MPRIDAGEGLGNAIAQPARGGFDGGGRAADASGLRAVGAGLQDVALTGIEGEARRAQQESEASLRSFREHQQKVEQENRARASAALIDYEVEVGDVGSGLIADMQTGMVSRGEWENHFTEKEKKIREAAMAEIAPDLQKPIVARIDRSLQRARLGLTRAAETQRRAEIAGHVESIRDGMSKLATRPDADLKGIHGEFAIAARTLLPQAGLGANVEKVVQDFEDRTTSAYIVARLNESMDSLPALKALKTRVSGDEFTELDPERKNILIHSIDGAMARLEHRQQGAQSRVLAELGGDIQAAESAISDGYPQNVEQIASLSRRARGTPLEDAFKRLNATNVYVQQWVNAPVGTMEGELLRLDAEVKAKPTPEGIAMVRSLTAVMDAKAKGVVQTPYAQAVKDGAPFTPIDYSSAPALQASLASRVAAVRGQKARNPQASLGIFLETEVSAFRTFVDTQPAEAKAMILSNLVTQMGDPRVVSDTMRQVSKESRVLAQAGMLAAWGGPNAAIAALSGAEILEGKKGAFTMPPDSAFLTQWQATVGKAYGDNIDAENDDFHTAKAIYAHLAKGDNKANEREPSGRLWKQAIEMATGGVTEYNDSDVIVPYGSEAGNFKESVHRAIDKAFVSGRIAGAAKVTGTKEVPDIYLGRRIGTKTVPTYAEDSGNLTADDLKAQGLETIGQGQYRVRSGASMVTDIEGRPLVLDLRKSEPAFYFQSNVRVRMPKKGEGGATTGGVPTAPAIKGEPLVDPFLTPGVDLSPSIERESERQRALSKEVRPAPQNKRENRKTIRDAKQPKKGN